MAHRHEVQRAKGGRTFYSGKGSKVAKEAESTGGGFKKGGKVHGRRGKHRLDRRARGGAVHMTAGADSGVGRLEKRQYGLKKSV